jgi:gamma-glutamylcyclotransferase (GGCT)/AIG2-like uncharacterized protein YtfP
MLYFAYGSNLDQRQMRARCPGSRHVGRALLEGHRLVFTRWSEARKGGVASLLPAPDQEVWGALYDITEKDLAALDAAEGYDPLKFKDQNAYNREERVVFRDGNTNDPLAVWLYIAYPQGDHFKPHPDYWGPAVAGAEESGLPADYVDSMRTWAG